MKLKYNNKIHHWAVVIAAIAFSVEISAFAGFFIGVPVGLVCALLYHICMKPD